MPTVIIFSATSPSEPLLAKNLMRFSSLANLTSC
jgi:hypothetical protein